MHISAIGVKGIPLVLHVLKVLSFLYVDASIRTMHLCETHSAYQRREWWKCLVITEAGPLKRAIQYGPV